MDNQEIDQVQNEELTLNEELSQALNDEQPIEEVVESQQETEVLEPLAAPEFYTKEHKEIFSKLNDIEGGRDIQEGWINQYNETQDFIKNNQKEADLWKKEQETYNQYQQAVQPMLQEWQMQGVHPALKMAQYVAYEQQLKQDPQGTLLKLAESYGVDLNEALAEQPYVDSTVRTLQQQNSQLQQAQQQQAYQMQQWQEQQKQEKILSEISSFQSQKDSAGNLVNAHFDIVQDDMATLINMGKADTIQDAYNIAIKYNDKVQQATQQEQLAKKQEEVKKAKNATTRINSKSKDAPEAEMTMREQLAANMG